MATEYLQVEIVAASIAGHSGALHLSPHQFSLEKCTLRRIVDSFIDQEMSGAPLPIALPIDYLRNSKIQRPRSASRATIFGAYACRACLDQVGHLKARSIGIVGITTTATLETSQRFETIGLSEGWNLVDPFLLPNAIPSAFVTQISTALKLTGWNVCLSDGFKSFSDGFALAETLLQIDHDLVILVAAEGASSLANDAMAQFKDKKLIEGAVAFALTKRNKDENATATARIFCGEIADSVQMPERDPVVLYSSLAPFLTTLKMLSQGNSKIGKVESVGFVISEQ
jgi:hypothetical protein